MSRTFNQLKRKEKTRLYRENKCLHSFINTKTQPINQVCNGYSGTENEQSSKKNI